MSRVDSVDADPSDVQRIEREVDDQQVTVLIVDAKNDSRIIVDGEQRWELEIGEDEWAYPSGDNRSHPPWMESLLADFGVRGIRTGVRGEQ
ncbi:hypothetical protein [Haloplanus sp. C73]|uniref:hypothetical protein n=1 Tax=Haloplanus sp. C73 TaxID=3421641 RepID=UPI003EBD394C